MRAGELKTPTGAQLKQQSSPQSMKEKVERMNS